MLFGRKEEIEEASASELLEVVTKLFDAKVSSLDLKASRIASEIEESITAFKNACERFGKLGKDPDFEYMKPTNEAQVRNNKGIYVYSLLRTMEPTQREHKGTRYHKYRAVLDSTKGMIDEVLRINGMFRQVLEAYSNDLDDFKRSFSKLEKNVKRLEAELAARGSDLTEYETLERHIDALRAAIDERDAIKREVAEASSVPSKDTDPESRLHALEDAERRRRGELDRLEEMKAKLKSGILTSLGVMQKAARKYDHSSASRLKIGDYIANAESMLLRDPAGFADFREQAASMNAAIMDGSIGIKPAKDLTEAIGFVLSGKMEDMVKEFNDLDAKAKPISDELADMRIEIDKIAGVRGHILDAKREISELNARIAELERSTSLMKSDIERGIYSAYRKRIRIL